MLRCFRIAIRFSIISLLFPFTVNAALSATTAKTIQGTEPRLSTVLEAEITNEGFSRFGFSYNSTNYNDSNISSLPNFSPLTTSPSSLKSALKSTLNATLSSNDAKDTDGDSNFALVGIDDSNMVLASDALSIKIRDSANNDITALTSTFCDLSSSNPPPYKIEISNNLRLTTAYGDPRKKDYTLSTAETSLKQPSKQYPFSLNITICEVQPNSQYNYGTNAAWTGTGFKVISPTAATGNFPTTGFNGAFFDIKVAGIDVTTLAFSPTTITQNSVKAIITTPSQNKVRITLSGPSSGQKGGSGPLAFVAPGAIEIKDTTNKISYKFNITKWFIPKSGAAGGYFAAKTYCGTTLSGYHLPKRSEYTNNPLIFLATCPGNGTDTGGTSCKGGNYSRAIGGGVLSEWGNVIAYYNGSDWEGGDGTWTIDEFNGGSYYGVGINAGMVDYVASSYAGYRAACVSN